MYTALSILRLLEEYNTRIAEVDIVNEPRKYKTLTKALQVSIKQECERDLPPSPEELSEYLEYPPV